MWVKAGMVLKPFTSSHINTITHTEEEDDKALCVISISGNFIPKKKKKKKEFLHERKTVLSPRQSEKSQATTSEQRWADPNNQDPRVRTLLTTLVGPLGSGSGSGSPNTLDPNKEMDLLVESDPQGKYYLKLRQKETYPFLRIPKCQIKDPDPESQIPPTPLSESPLSL